MGRPPNVPCHSPTRPWAPPLHFAGGLLRGTLTPHSNKVRQFVLPIPPVPTATAKAIRESLVGAVQPFAAQQNRIRTLTSKVLDQRAKTVSSQKRITELEDEKEQGLRDIRETRQQETADIVAAVERKLRSRYNKEAAAAHAIWKENLEEECEAKRKEWRLQQENQLCHSHEGEPEKKRTKLEDDKQECEKSVSAVDHSDSDNMVKSDMAIAPVAPTSEEMIEQRKKTDALREKLLEAEATLEKLTETRTEIVWLLKQVIQVDMKRGRTAPTSSAATTAPQKR